ncbi:hypothetical protein KPH14_008722 [Odynerus spinipes]|uniref:Uncharacterized protein n=1 Tax=Odynerus spinipes TaxID=1348599 RepID=A0AAD9R8G9_9HYME|nr:hypothetical protein KPH14_008722 [Odynerus spinipes]
MLSEEFVLVPPQNLELPFTPETWKPVRTVEDIAVDRCTREHGPGPEKKVQEVTVGSSDTFSIASYAHRNHRRRSLELELDRSKSSVTVKKANEILGCL